MNQILSFMDKIYGDTKILTTIYIIGAILLFIFIVLLIFSLHSTGNKKKLEIDNKIKTNEENTNDIKKENIEEKVEQEQTIEEKAKKLAEDTAPIPINIEIKKLDEEVASNEENLEIKKNDEEVLTNEEKVDDKKIPTEINEEIKIVDKVKSNNNENEKTLFESDSLDAEKADIKKSYEKNEQFSSVYVGNNTSTIKLDNVLDKLNVDKDIRDEIAIKSENSIDEDNQIKKSDTIGNLDDLKLAMDKKKKEIEEKQNELKDKLFGLKNNINHD